MGHFAPLEELGCWDANAGWTFCLIVNSSPFYIFFFTVKLESYFDAVVAGRKLEVLFDFCIVSSKKVSLVIPFCVLTSLQLFADC